MDRDHKKVMKFNEIKLQCTDLANQESKFDDHLSVLKQALNFLVLQHLAR